MLELTNSVTHSATTDIFVKILITLQSAVAGLQITAYKDDHCDKNVMFKDFGLQYRLFSAHQEAPFNYQSL